MTSSPRSKVKGARSRDQSEPSWPNAVHVSLEAGGGIPCWPNPAATPFVRLHVGKLGSSLSVAVKLTSLE